MRRLAALLALAGAAAPTSAATSFERAFDTRGEPKALHARLLYRSAGAVHRTEFWRDRDRLARTTDGIVRSFASRRPHDAGYALTVLDDKRRIRTDVDRDSLIHQGNFTEWFDLAHGLRHPLGRYTLTALPGSKSPVAPVAPCRWYALAQNGHRTTICWSTDYRLPMLMLSDRDGLVWRVTAVDTAPVPPARFQIAAAGYVRVDASRDIEGD